MSAEAIGLESCTIVIAAGDAGEGLTRTVASINRQSALLAIDMLHWCEHTEGATGPGLIRRDMPWSRPLRSLHCVRDALPSAALNASKADYFLFLDAGDVLFENALRELRTGLVATASAAVAACRFSDGETAWSHPLVDEFFSLPGQVRHDHMPKGTEAARATLVLYRRSCLRQADTCSVSSFSLVKEYVAERCEARRSRAGCAYVVPVQKQVRCYGEPLTPRYPKSPEKKLRSHGPWLFGERQGMAAEDNAWALFKHCRDECPDIESYFVLHPNAAVDVPPQYAPHVLRCGDARWAQALARASHVLVTDSAADVLGSRPEDRPESSYVFVTHGSSLFTAGEYLRSHRYFDRIVAVSSQEIACAAPDWGFPVGSFVASGLPRWDHLRPGMARKREVLLCPTWRRTLDTIAWSEGAVENGASSRAFRQSLYFRALASLLKSADLLACLKRHDLRLTVRLHFRTAPFLGLFREFETDRVSIHDPLRDRRSLAETMQDCVALITDYSSIMWDMAYMEKPVICYAFDKPAMLVERRRCGFFLADSELVAESCYRGREVAARLDEIASRGFELTAPQQARLDRLIPHRDGGNAARLVEFLRPRTIQARPRAGRSTVDGQAPDVLRPLGAALQAEENQQGIAVIGCPLPGHTSGDAVWLSAADWEEQLRAGEFEVLLIEPFLDSACEWGERFFDRIATAGLLQHALALGNALGIDVRILWSAVLPYQPEDLGLEHARSLIHADWQHPDSCYDVSVIVPVFNGAAHLRRCLDSILSQVLQGSFEVLVVDDGSDDDTPAILAEYAGRHRHLVVVRQHNMRQGMARNHGLLRARGEYVTFVDADDVLPSDALAQLHVAVRQRLTDLSIGLVASWKPGSKSQSIAGFFWHYMQAPRVISTSRWPHVLWDTSCVGKLYRRSFLLQHRLFFPQSFHEDLAFRYRLCALDGSAAIVRAVTYLYVPRPTTEGLSGTQQFTPGKLEQMLLVGRVAAADLKASTLADDISTRGLGFLLLRYDRFLWRYQHHAAAPIFGDANWPVIAQRLSCLLAQADDRMILAHCRKYSLFFLALKHGVRDLALRALADAPDAVLADAEREGLLPEMTIDELRAFRNDAVACDHYRKVTIEFDGSIADTAYVTDMSYGYRVGLLFCDEGGELRRWLLLLPRLLALTFDMLTLRGRRKEAERRQALAAQSSVALQDHSERVLASRPFRIGVIFMESLTQGNPSRRQVWKHLRRIRDDPARSTGSTSRAASREGGSR